MFPIIDLIAASVIHTRGEQATAYLPNVNSILHADISMKTHDSLFISQYVHDSIVSYKMTVLLQITAAFLDPGMCRMPNRSFRLQTGRRATRHMPAWDRHNLCAKLRAGHAGSV